MLNAVSQNQIKVYAEEKNEANKKTDKTNEIDTIKQQLVNDQIDISENPFATKRLIESHPKIQTNIEVVPYENRIIIPKIGRNIPLVDVHI
jgi:hypothetical protein